MGEDAATNTETEIENVDTTTTTTAVSEGKKTTQGSSMASRLLRWWTLGRKDMNAPLVTVRDGLLWRAIVFFFFF